MAWPFRPANPPYGYRFGEGLRDCTLPLPLHTLGPNLGVSKPVPLTEWGWLRYGCCFGSHGANGTGRWVESYGQPWQSWWGVG